MKFCCGVTLYYPSKEELENVVKYSEVFEKVYIFDNTNKEDKIIQNEKYFIHNQKFNYYSDKKNNGLSVAYNKMCKYAINDDFDYICLFDQDSRVNYEDILKIQNYIKIQKNKNCALYAPQIIYEHKYNKYHLENDKITETKVDWAISSGSFINLYLYSKTNGFDENYFIDRIDHDYCITVKKLGYEIIQLGGVYLKQKLGESKKFILVNVSQHSELRHYYIFRNRYYYYLKNNKGVYIKLKLAILSVFHIIKVILFEENKVRKCKIMMKARADFIEGKMGKISY